MPNCFVCYAKRPISSVLTAAYPAGSTTRTIPFTIPGGNLIQPPASLVAAIITGVPPSILVALAQPTARSSIAADFKAGNTPAWYQTLALPVKSYIESLESQIAGGEVNLNATASTFSFPLPTETTTPAPGPGEHVATKSSKAVAAQATGEAAFSFTAVVIFVVVAMAL
jgi:hypothetical protein